MDTYSSSGMIRDVLRRVIEERFVASHDGDVAPDLLWSRYFCPDIQGRVTRDYILDVILDRPRDLIYFASVAVATAVNRRHVRVECEDVLEAEKQYSLYALESVVVENTLPDIDLEAILFEFAGCPTVMSKSAVSSTIMRAGVPSQRVPDVVDVLCGLTFLGIQVGENMFAFAEDPQRYRRDEVRARRFAEQERIEIHYKVHAAFRAFLEIH